MKFQSFFKVIFLILISVAIFAKMPAISLDGSIFEGKTTLEYGIYVKESGERVAQSTVIVEVEDSMVLIDDSLNESLVSLRLPGLEPYYGDKTIHFNGDYEIHSQFEGDSIFIDATTPNGDQSIRQEIPQRPLLHNDQLLFSIPAMDFSVQKQSLTLFIPANATFIDMAVVVKGKEKVEVPAGEFEVYRVVFDFGMDVQYGLYLVEKPHNLVFYDNNQIQYKLEKIETE